jgi:hypothetical protein
MMSSPKFLDFEVALLLAKYGKSALLAALAKKLQLTPEQLEEMLQARLSEVPVSRPKKRTDSADVIARLAQEHPEKTQYLRDLTARFENRTFLREFRDVKRFFEEHGRSLGTAKSRAMALPTVLHLLVDLDVAELETLCQAQPEDTYSSLGIISDEILRRDR